MGRHAAGDGDGVHPVVAAALARRAADNAGAHRDVFGERYATQRIEGHLGWPGEPPAPGGGLGWPGDLTPDAPATPARDETDLHARAQDDQNGDDQTEDEPDDADGARDAGTPRRGWRRLLGLDRAA